MTPTKEMIALAERIADGYISRSNWTVAYNAALTAIMETSEKAAEYLQGLAVKRSDHLKVAAIRNGEHLR